MFMLIFYFQGALSYDALMAGILTIPLAAGMLLFSPLAGWLGDRYGETTPATVGIIFSFIGLVGLAMDTGLYTPYWQLAFWMTLISIGSGLFNSPNSSSIMNAAGPKYRGEASGIRSLTANLGMMLSVAFTIPLVTQSIPREAMLAIFSGTQVGLENPEQSLSGFITGLHTVFWVMAAMMVMAGFLSVMRAGRIVKHEAVQTVLLRNKLDYINCSIEASTENTVPAAVFFLTIEAATTRRGTSSYFRNLFVITC